MFPGSGLPAVLEVRRGGEEVEDPAPDHQTTPIPGPRTQDHSLQALLGAGVQQCPRHHRYRAIIVLYNQCHKPYTEEWILPPRHIVHVHVGDGDGEHVLVGIVIVIIIVVVVCKWKLLVFLPHIICS